MSALKVKTYGSESLTMSFNEAFRLARKELGEGSIFKWYNPKSKQYELKKVELRKPVLLNGVGLGDAADAEFANMMAKYNRKRIKSKDGTLVDVYYDAKGNAVASMPVTNLKAGGSGESTVIGDKTLIKRNTKNSSPIRSNDVVNDKNQPRIFKSADLHGTPVYFLLDNYGNTIAQTYDNRVVLTGFNDMGVWTPINNNTRENALLLRTAIDESGKALDNEQNTKTANRNAAEIASVHNMAMAPSYFNLAERIGIMNAGDVRAAQETTKGRFMNGASYPLNLASHAVVGGVRLLTTPSYTLDLYGAGFNPTKVMLGEVELSTPGSLLGDVVTGVNNSFGTNLSPVAATFAGNFAAPFILPILGNKSAQRGVAFNYRQKNGNLVVIKADPNLVSTKGKPVLYLTEKPQTSVTPNKHTPNRLYVNSPIYGEVHRFVSVNPYEYIGGSKFKNGPMFYNPGNKDVILNGVLPDDSPYALEYTNSGTPGFNWLINGFGPAFNGDTYVEPLESTSLVNTIGSNNLSIGILPVFNGNQNEKINLNKHLLNVTSKKK